MVERLDQKAARAAGRVEQRFAEARIRHRDHESHDGARRVKLAGIARRIAHLAQHGFVERAQRVQLVAGGEMNAVELVDDIAQQVSADHAVLHALEYGGYDIAPSVRDTCRIGTGQQAQVAEQTRSALGFSVGPRQSTFFVVDESEQFVTGDAVGLSRPIAPAVRRLDGGLELFPGELGLALALNFQVVQKFQEHDPSEHRQPVKVAIQPLVFAHDVARGFQECAEGLGGGWMRSLFSHVFVFSAILHDYPD